MIDVERIDYWAASGTGPFHRASVVAKAIFLLLVVSAAVLTTSPYPLAAGYAVMLAAAAATGLPFVRMILLSLYAAMFAILYGISIRGGADMYAVMILKAITPAFAMLALIVSTPYPRIFAFLSSLLPEIIAVGLFMTYRSLFILLEMMEHFIAAIRLRGGFSPGSIINNSSNLARGIAMLLVHAVERSERLYAVMAVRGYNGSMAEAGTFGFRSADWLPLGTGVLVFSLALAGRCCL